MYFFIIEQSLPKSPNLKKEFVMRMKHNQYNFALGKIRINGYLRTIREKSLDFTSDILNRLSTVNNRYQRTKFDAEMEKIGESPILKQNGSSIFERVKNYEGAIRSMTPDENKKYRLLCADIPVDKFHDFKIASS